ncbi:MAG: uroporphyrinogen-III synthase [Candidatus Rokubacteria bacterium]|nr:uroporphyrinogen-III synthase [Candidatus Rokubacteria bacterium]
MSASEVEVARPLAGRVIAVTRAREQSARFAALLEEAGAAVLAVPTIAIEPPESWEALDAALVVPGYDWVIFTSVNGVAMVERRHGRGGALPPAFAGARFAAIGPATAEAMARWGIPPEIVPEEYVAEALVAALAPRIRRGDRILLARAADARAVLADELARLGARITEVAAYRTREPAEGGEPLGRALREGRVDAVTFTSSSTVRHLARLLGPDEVRRLLGAVPVACIGPVTAATARELGLEPAILPATYTIPALARAIIAYFADRPDRRPRAGG